MRAIEGPLGRVVAEPRVMQVLLAFSDAQGEVLTREDLIRTCWSGAVVGDDAVNRAIAEVRRVARVTGAAFGVETIPRVGYRLKISPATPEPAAEPAQPGRRKLLYLALGIAVAASAGLWAFHRRADPRFDALMDEGRQALRLSQPGGMRKAVDAFQAATSLRKDDAGAWGLLALSQRLVADIAKGAEAAQVRLAAEAAMRRALQLQENEPNALLARMLMQRPTLDWYDMERELRRILAAGPDNPHALDMLVAMLQAAGYLQESFTLNEQAIQFDALRPVPQYRRALKLWINGQPDEADKQSLYSLENWPMVSTARNARLIVCAFTDRFAAAQALLEDPLTTQTMLSAAGMRMWKLGLAALESRTASTVRAAREECLTVAPAGPGNSVHAVLLLSALGEIDAAYEVIEGFMLHRGLRVPGSSTVPVTEFEGDLSWRTTQWLYTPVTTALREDSRYAALADVIGLSRYWMRRGAPPDERRPVA